MLCFKKKKYKASIIENKSLLNENSCLKENNHNVVKFDVPCKKHVFDCDEKTALIDKIKYLEHDCCEKDKLIKLLEEKESNIVQELGKTKVSIKKLTIGAQKLDKIIEASKPCGDKRGLGYVDECSTPLGSKTIFVKPSTIMPKPNTCKFVSRFVPICHSWGVEDHTRRNCLKLKNSQNIISGRKFSQNIKFNNVLRNNFSIENRIHKLSPRNKFLHVVCFWCGKFFNMNASIIPKFVKINLLGPNEYGYQKINFEYLYL